MFVLLAMINVVVDTNVWLSLILNNRLSFLYDAVQSEQLTIFASEALRKELLDVLQYKKFKGRFLPMLENYGRAFDIIVRSIEPAYTFTASPDPKDNYLFDICREAGASYLVTGDRALLGMKSVSFSRRHTTEVISLSRFRALLA
jgi:putative PIN family toxin of toxin-antitoxin system